MHHCDAFAGEDFSCLFCSDATIACGQKYAELARREPHCSIRTEDESAYSLPCTLHESALRCFRCTFCASDAMHTCDERLYDRTKRLLCLGKILRHVEVRNVGCSHRCCKCYHDEHLLALVARAGLNYTAAVQEGCGEVVALCALPLLCSRRLLRCACLLVLIIGLCCHLSLILGLCSHLVLIFGLCFHLQVRHCSLLVLIIGVAPER